MPDLNLKNMKVREKLADVMRFWLKQPSVRGLQISGFNVLLESFETNDVIIESDVEASILLLDEWKKIAEEDSYEDGLHRMLMIQILKSEHLSQWQKTYRNSTFGVAVVPFTLRHVLTDGVIIEKRDDLTELIREYVSEIPIKSWPIWEIDNNDVVRQYGEIYGRIPNEMNELSMILTMLLPGCVIIYYGNEIGMSNHKNIQFEETKDPYALPPYANQDNYLSKSKDGSRTPMHWSPLKNAGFTNARNSWLPVHPDYKEINVESECDAQPTKTHLQLFKKLTQLRSEENRNFSPFRDLKLKLLFCFTYFIETAGLCRKSAESNSGYFVIVYFDFEEKFIDFTITYPYFPAEGVLVAQSNPSLYANSYDEGEVVDMSKVRIQRNQALVFRLSFPEMSPEEEKE